MRNILTALFLVLPILVGFGQTNDSFTRTEDLIYGRKTGMALTLDVFAPRSANGAGILWIVSSGYGSSHAAINPKYFQRLLERGYTIFAVVHGSAPKFSVPEIEIDIQRAARFVRHNAGRFGVDPLRLGAIGASAGGHLALVLATQGGPGKAEATDPVDRESSAVQCSVGFFPPTDYLNYGAPGREAAWIEPLLGLQTNSAIATNLTLVAHKIRREISPIYFIHSNQPPVLIFQGDKDYMVPVEQAKSFVEQSRSIGAIAKLIIKPGQGHGWPDMSQEIKLAVDWFDEHLATQKQKSNLKVKTDL